MFSREETEIWFGVRRSVPLVTFKQGSVMTRQYCWAIIVGFLYFKLLLQKKKIRELIRRTFPIRHHPD